MDVVLACVIGVPVYDPDVFNGHANDNMRPGRESSRAGRRDEPSRARPNEATALYLV